jgi:hypothetical protein
MDKWFPDWNSVEHVIETFVAEFFKGASFKVLLDKIRTHPEQSKFRDQFIRTAVACGEEEYKTTNSAEKAIKWAMLYIAFTIAKDNLAAKTIQERVGDAIINGACDECKVKITFSNLQNTLSNIVKFVSEKSIEIYNAGKETRRLAVEKERVEAEKARDEAAQAITDAKIREQIAEGKKNAELVRSSSVERLASSMSDWKGVLPSFLDEGIRTKILDQKFPKIRVIRFVQMLLFILEAKKAQITTVNAFEKFFKTLFIAWLKGKDVAGYNDFTHWMATNHFKINLDTLDPCETYYYLQEWNKYVKLIVEEDKKYDIDTRATAVYKCPAWLLVNHITFDQVLSALTQKNIYNENPILSRDGNTIVWSKENFNSFEKFNFKEDDSVVSARRRRQGQYDDDDW